MRGYGLQVEPSGAQAPQETLARPREASVGGIMAMRPVSALLEDAKAAAAAAQEANNAPVVTSLASHVRRHWQIARDARQNVEQRMLAAVRAKRGEYAPDKLARLMEQGSSTIYMMLFATKARQAKALLGDVLLGSKDDKPWSTNPTPDPELPPDVVALVLQEAHNVVAQAEMSGMPMTPMQVREGLREVKEALISHLEDEARKRGERAEVKLEDMLAEGGFIEALDQVLDDLTMFPTAFLKGPIMRKQAQLTWSQAEDGTNQPTAVEVVKPLYERADPLMMYPAPWARSVHDGFLFERHKLAPSAVSDLIGVEGYNEDALREVLKAHGTDGLRNWLAVDSERAQAEGREGASLDHGSDLIEALQYWGSVTGKLLREWGLGEDEVPDEAKVYEVEAWLIGSWVIKAVINADPLARRPYYADSFERVAGAFWGNSLYDTMSDCEDMCNAAARALANNMGIASGPQVWTNVDRLPAGENITSMYPWKVWQTTSDQMNGTAAPMGFFQPTSNANELMAVFDKFSVLADEVTGIPRYMAGIGGGAGEAGRTASGMSMMIGNANKTVKKTIASVDLHIIGPAVKAGYEWLMRYSGDPDIKGDLKVVARGALSLVAKDAAQVRRNEFLAATANPIDMQIIGVEGRAQLLRETAKNLDMNTAKIVPSERELKAKIAQAMAMAAGAPPAPGDGAQQPQPGGGRHLPHGQGPAVETFQNS